MWKRENETTPENANPSPAGSAPRREAPSAPPPRASEPSSPPSTSGGSRAVIGGATVVRGEISGEEDLLIEGRVEGKIQLAQNAVTIGAKGRLSAEVVARAILIDGEVDGDLTAEEQIVLRKGGRVRGDLTAPRVTIEDGARFKGSIDMEPKRSSSSVSPAASSSVSPAASSSPKPAANVPKPDPVASLAAAASSSSGPKS